MKKFVMLAALIGTVTQAQVSEVPVFGPLRTQPQMARVSSLGRAPESAFNLSRSSLLEVRDTYGETLEAKLRNDPLAGHRYEFHVPTTLGAGESIGLRANHGIHGLTVLYTHTLR